MSEVRVFELAQELNMPAKQLLTKMRKAGIPVTGNFSELSLDQAQIVRKMAKSAKGIVLPKAAGIRRKKATAKDAEETAESKQAKPKQGSSIVTISTKSKLDQEVVEGLPKRRVRRKKKDNEELTTETNAPGKKKQRQM